MRTHRHLAHNKIRLYDDICIYIYTHSRIINININIDK